MLNFAAASLSELIAPGGHDCACGRHHEAGLEYVRVGAGAVKELPDALNAVGAKRPFVVCDHNTGAVALAAVRDALGSVPHTVFELPMARVEPNEEAMGALCMAFDPACDIVLAVGSGVVNDTCRMLARTAGLRSAVVATAPSMDGYASNSSAMVSCNLKVSINYRCPVFILADTDLVKTAPDRMLRAGLGDMLAKYNALAEWKMANLVTDEPYCENIAELVRASLRKVTANAGGLMLRQPAAIDAVIEGLILSGLAMSFMQSSRPASGLEHYFSHIWEMRALERGAHSALHGEQVGVGLLLTCRVRDAAVRLTPNRSIADAWRCDFDEDNWQRDMRRILGRAAEAVIRDEHEKYHKNTVAKSGARYARIEAHWPEICQALLGELPPTEEIEKMMRAAQMDMTPEALGVPVGEDQLAYLGARDLRDKYLLNSMLWDMGYFTHESVMRVFRRDAI